MVAKSWKDNRTSPKKKKARLSIHCCSFPKMPLNLIPPVSNLFAKQFSFNAQEVEHWAQTEGADKGYSDLSDSDSLQSILEREQTKVCEISNEQTQDDVRIPSDGESTNYLEKVIIWLGNQMNTESYRRYCCISYVRMLYKKSNPYKWQSDLKKKLRMKLCPL